MKRTAVFLAALVAGLALAPVPAAAGAVVGQAAPTLALTDSNGQTRTLADLKGQVVVLEWWNHQCPFVNKHYASGNMQMLQKRWTGRGVAWLAISSSGPRKQGFVDGTRANAIMKEKGGAPSAVLLDHDGRVGRAWAARTTPHMFVVDGKGTVVYAGGIDDKPSTDQADIATASNFVEAALREVTAGQAVTTPTSDPYGCSVKYAD